MFFEESGFSSDYLEMTELSCLLCKPHNTRQHVKTIAILNVLACLEGVLKYFHTLLFFFTGSRSFGSWGTQTCCRMGNTSLDRLVKGQEKGNIIMVIQEDQSVFSYMEVDGETFKCERWVGW